MASADQTPAGGHLPVPRTHIDEARQHVDEDGGVGTDLADCAAAEHGLLAEQVGRSFFEFQSLF